MNEGSTVTPDQINTSEFGDFMKSLNGNNTEPDANAEPLGDPFGEPEQEPQSVESN